MLGAEIYDPYNVESGLEKVAGIGLLDAVTVMQKEKRTLQVEAEICDDPGILEGTQGLKVKGYEIHMGITTPGSGCRPFSMICRNGNPALGQPDGACDKEGKVVGTYIHGIFDNSEFMMRIINNLRRKKGLHELDRQGLDHNEFKQMEYDRLAQLIREHVDMTKVYEIMNNWKEGTV